MVVQATREGGCVEVVPAYSTIIVIVGGSPLCMMTVVVVVVVYTFGIIIILGVPPRPETAKENHACM
jgi:hypothetical protein